jgi:endoglucanase Acf2
LDLFFGLGNDQESSSEAIHAWAAVAQWGEAFGWGVAAEIALP